MKKVTEEQYKENLRQLITTNEKFEAIKYIRNITNLSLKDSKELVDMFFADISNLNGYTLEIKTEVADDSELNKNELNFVYRYLQNEEKIKAVKYVRDRLNCSLKDAKKLVDSLQTKQKKTGAFYNEKDEFIAAFESEEEQKPNAGTESTERFS
ncbi:MAG: hypothetical protein K8R54_08320 [Bacteroidales bacterium]|nr:hypothetical protein [Bacteroidales bacterium]